MAQETSPPRSPFASTALYVGDLDPSVNEAQIFDIFKQIGNVMSVRLCRDMVTKRSLGYAYVNYNNTQDASRAIEELNFMPVNGKPVRIMFSYRDPSIRKSGSGNLFVKNLDKSIDNKALHDLFSPYGKILSCKIALDVSNVSKGHGFVQFDTEDAAHTAIEKINGTTLHDKQLFVGPFVRRQERDPPASKFNNVFVKNLSEITTDEDLQKLFGVFGPISSAVVMKEVDGKSKCFGFVNFENPEDAVKAVEDLHGTTFQDKELYVSRAQKKNEREAELKAKFEHERKDTEDKSPTNLYLKNLDDGIDDEKLKDMFSAFGNVTSCKVMRDPLGHSKGSGFVAFSTSDAALRAVAQMNGKMIGSKPLYVAMAQKKEERKAKLEAQFASRGPVNFPPPPLYSAVGQQLLYSRPAPMVPQQPAGFAMVRPNVGQMPGFFPPQRQQGHARVPFQQFMQRESTFHGSNSRTPAYGNNSFLAVLASHLASATPEQQRIVNVGRAAVSTG
ncbi:polyadenylate-binding protein 2 isoform X2 [Selaginella moellendorffii]|uniref:polyadenylate-binding protein 2 isoform X2 n=1 Tax=Selaginella moellendorffii TaxID=88036 RepID=UPI000D1C82EE|nr:polyadenylate-binding protein 2 isoform X2 [Selaginella moellendorffii]|eukprot:XP_024516877.1 polyadenylate-binding protein 2 isoform X2 [Selaginella moellendorffii]